MITITNHFPAKQDIIVEVLNGDVTKAVRITEGNYGNFEVKDGISILLVPKLIKEAVPT